jgi:hypothetical protein
MQPIFATASHSNRREANMSLRAPPSPLVRPGLCLLAPAGGRAIAVPMSETGSTFGYKSTKQNLLDACHRERMIASLRHLGVRTEAADGSGEKATG